MGGKAEMSWRPGMIIFSVSLRCVAAVGWGGICVGLIWDCRNRYYFVVLWTLYPFDVSLGCLRRKTRTRFQWLNRKIKSRIVGLVRRLQAGDCSRETVVTD